MGAARSRKYAQGPSRTGQNSTIVEQSSVPALAALKHSRWLVLLRNVRRPTTPGRGEVAFYHGARIKRRKKGEEKEGGFSWF